MKEAIFSEAVLVSNYHGWKEEVMKLIPCCITIIIYRTVKPSHFKKLQIIQNIENLMLRVIFKISLNFDKENHSFLHALLLLGETDFWKNDAWGNE